MKRALPVAVLALGGCVAKPLPAVRDVRFDPIRFFSAPAEGTGMLHTLAGKSVPVHVSSVSEGNLDHLKVIQSIREGDKPPKERIWTIRRVGDGRYAATVTDAVGPVSLTVNEGRALIRYRMHSGLSVRQELALQEGPPALCNRLTIRKLGIRVAWLNETIRRIPLGRGAPDCPA